MKTVSVKNMVLRRCWECACLFLRLYRHLVNQPRNTASENSLLVVLCSHPSGYSFLHLRTQPIEQAACRGSLSLQSSASAHILLLIRSYVMEQSPAHIWQTKICWEFPLINFFFSCLQEMILWNPAGYHSPLLNKFNSELFVATNIFHFLPPFLPNQNRYGPSFGESCTFKHPMPLLLLLQPLFELNACSSMLFFHTRHLLV